MAKQCRGCEENFDVETREQRVAFSTHVRGCSAYRDLKEEELAANSKVSNEAKEQAFLERLTGEGDIFQEEQRYALLEAVKIMLEA